MRHEDKVEMFMAGILAAMILTMFAIHMIFN